MRPRRADPEAPELSIVRASPIPDPCKPSAARHAPQARARRPLHSTRQPYTHAALNIDHGERSLSRSRLGPARAASTAVVDDDVLEAPAASSSSARRCASEFRPAPHARAHAVRVRRFDLEAKLSVRCRAGQSRVTFARRLVQLAPSSGLDMVDADGLLRLRRRRAAWRRQAGTPCESRMHPENAEK